MCFGLVVTLGFWKSNIKVQHSLHSTKGSRGPRGPLCLCEGAAWWAARLCSSILPILPCAEHSVSVGDGPTMEVISLISASIVARRIINVHLWRERAREWREKKAVAFASQLLQRCHFFLCWGFFLWPSLPVSHFVSSAASPSPRCALVSQEACGERRWNTPERCSSQLSTLSKVSPCFSLMPSQALLSLRVFLFFFYFGCFSFLCKHDRCNVYLFRPSASPFIHPSS